MLSCCRWVMRDVKRKEEEKKVETKLLDRKVFCLVWFPLRKSTLVERKTVVRAKKGRVGGVKARKNW